MDYYSLSACESIMKILLFFIVHSSINISSTLTLSTKVVDIDFLVDIKAEDEWKIDICTNPLPIMLCASDVDRVSIHCSHEWPYNPKEVFLGKNDNSTFRTLQRGTRQSKTSTLITGEILLSDCFYCSSQVINPNMPNSKAVEWRSAAFAINLSPDCPKDRPRTNQIHNVGDNVTLNCWEEAVEENHTIQWYYRSLGYKEYAEIFYAFRPGQNISISFSNISVHQSGTYKCVISFHESMIQHYRQLDLWVLGGEPLKPTEPRVTALYNHMAIVEWTSMHPHPGHKGSFLVKYLEYMQPIDERLNSTEAIIYNQSKIVLSGLRPFTPYIVEVREFNDHGDSAPTYTAFLTRTTPFRQAFDIVKAAVANESVELRCHFYENMTFLLGGYVWLKYQENWDFLPLDHEGPYIIQRFQHSDAGAYKCRVSSVDLEVSFQLVMLHPPLQPILIKCLKTTNASLIISWKEQSLIRIPTDTYKVEKFKLRYRKLGGIGGWIQNILPSDKLEVLLESTEIGDGMYVMEMSAMNRAGESPKDRIYCVK